MAARGLHSCDAPSRTGLVRVGFGKGLMPLGSGYAGGVSALARLWLPVIRLIRTAFCGFAFCFGCLGMGADKSGVLQFEKPVAGRTSDDTANAMSRGNCR